MRPVTDSDWYTLRMPDAIKKAARKHYAKQKTSVSRAMLVALCNDMNRPDLIAEIRGRGRQKAEAPKKPPRRKKS